MNDTQKQHDEVQPSDVEAIKTDLSNLYSHAEGALEKKTKDVQEKWKATKKTLEEKRATLDEKARQFVGASGAASSDMRAGFSAAFAELKKAFSDAKAQFGGD